MFLKIQFLKFYGEISSFAIYLLQRLLVVTSMQITRKFDLINNDDVVGNIHRGRGGLLRLVRRFELILLMAVRR